MPASITWKGVDVNDKLLSDGEYNVYLEINQNKPRRQCSSKKKFRINTEEPIKEFKIESTQTINKCFVSFSRLCIIAFAVMSIGFPIIGIGRHFFIYRIF